ncbi:MAG: DNA methyltransferase [Eubacteriaceae bacterium]|nr:DNA methyltransferase [Eubacteriaceae bacterium]
MENSKQKQRAKEFAERWKDKGYEKGESQPFWLTLLAEVFGVEHPDAFISFEDQVHLDHTSFIDGYIPSTNVMIEQKSSGKDLMKGIRQSDGSMRTPFQQAQNYSAGLPYSLRPRWIITCNFQEFCVYDMEHPKMDPAIIKLEDLPKEYYRLQFIVEEKNQSIKKEMEVSVKAGNIIGKLYDALYTQYEAVREPTDDDLKSLNVLCVRLVFCFYAEDAGLFDTKSMFHNYLAKFDAETTRAELMRLFKVLDQEEKERDPFMREDLLAFPYVNGGLFANEDIAVPRFTEELRRIMLEDASENFDWSEISPTIFGAIFESTLNPETRRSGGMHYTSIQNIHKVINPLFLDDLKEELAEIKTLGSTKKISAAAKAFQAKLGQITFLDPAAGSGNFLTESFLSLRRLENEALKLRIGDQIIMGGDVQDPIEVSIDQFHGIEINDFAVTVAKTAMWIAESQMMQETMEIVHQDIDFLPLKTNVNMVEGNALRMDWNEVVPAGQLNYVMGNPPFVGARLMTAMQKQDVNAIFEGWKNAGNLDYVCCWYKKAADYIKGTDIRVALVSTNSVCQGVSVSSLWKPLMENGVHINFAHRTFRWDSEANIKAHVHCIIVGFSRTVNRSDDKMIFDQGLIIKADNISGYLIDAPNIFIISRAKPLCDVPKMMFGNMPNDGGNLIISKDEKNDIIKQDPIAKDYIRNFTGSKEFINNQTRYCIWLDNASPSAIKALHVFKKRLEKVKEMRSSSKRPSTRELASTPYLFGEIRQPDTSYIIIPRVSSERRRYIPMGFLSPEVITSDSTLIIPSASLYDFGVLESNIHMSWMRAVCGRLKSDYRYSKDIVYNNFPWPDPTPEQKAKIEQTAQGILDARALYPDSSLADLYDELTMPKELRTAHQMNDKAVMSAYGIGPRDPEYKSEAACVAMLMEKYQELTDSAK